MNAPVSFKTDNMSFPIAGSLHLPVRLDFTATTTVDTDLGQARQQQIIDYIQSVFVDNADNTAPLDLTFYGGQYPQRIRIPAFGQAILPVNFPVGQAAKFRAVATQGQTVDLIFSNIAYPYLVWGPADGVLVTPALTNRNLTVEPLVIGDNILVPAVAAQSVKLYRLLLTVGAGALLKFTDGPAGAVLFSAALTAGGSLTMQASGIPWLTTTAGRSLVMTSDAAANCYGGYGVTQS